MMLIAPILTELLSGNINLLGFLSPVTYPFLATIGYGFPILLLRELAVRKGVGLVGMLPLGLCYGIVNEGYLARTFFLPTHVPIDSFSQYGFWGGIEIPWAFTISAWHSLFAFLFPIAIVETWYPEKFHKPWLTDRALYWIGIPTFLITCLIYFSKSPMGPAGTAAHFIEISAAFGVLVFAAVSLPRRPDAAQGGSFRFRAAFGGLAAFCLVLLIPAILAGAKFPATLFIAYFLGLFGSAFFFLARSPAVAQTDLVVFALGTYFAMALFGILIGFSMGSPLQIGTEVAFIAVFGAGFVTLGNRRRRLHIGPATVDARLEHP